MARPRAEIHRFLLPLALTAATAAATTATAGDDAPAPAAAAGSSSAAARRRPAAPPPSPSGASGCRRRDVVVRQRATGRTVEGKPEYAVEVWNACRCAQSRVVVRCYGLSSVEVVDPRAIRAVDGERCLSWKRRLGASAAKSSVAGSASSTGHNYDHI